MIFHVDVNSAYLSWEATHRIKHKGSRIDLREIPSAIGGDPESRHGIILAKSIPAKKYQIQTGEALWQARQKCPNLYLAPPNYGLYEACSRALIKILREYTPDVEQYSIDEAYMDMAGTESLWGKPEAAAERIKNRVKEELGFTVNIGISVNKLLAKMASDFKKPDLVHTLYPEEIPAKMWRLPVNDLFFVGQATDKKLRNLGIRTIGELAHTDRELIRQHLKKPGDLIWLFANGIDVSSVIAAPPPNKGYGNSMTIAFDVQDAQQAKMVLLSLCETVAARLRHDAVQAKVLAVGIRDANFQYHTHQCVMSAATNCTLALYHTAQKLFTQLWNGNPIRHLSVQASRVHAADPCRQMELFAPDYEKYEKQDAAIDAIRSRYGVDAVQRAVFIRSPIYHIGGGIPKPSIQTRDVSL